MKKYTAGIFAAGAMVLSGLLFIGFGGMAYTAMGTQGELSAANISISLLFYICILFTAVFCGYRRISGVLAGIGITLAFFLTIGFMCYFGYAVITSELVAVFYIISAPFVPLIESITYALGLYAKADLTMILIPALFIMSLIPVYFIGANLRRHSAYTVHGNAKNAEKLHSEQLSA